MSATGLFAVRTMLRRLSSRMIAPLWGSQVGTRRRETLQCGFNARARRWFSSRQARGRIEIFPAAYSVTSGRLCVVLLQRLAQRPAAWQQLAGWFGETAAERPKPLDADLDFGARIDEVVMIAAGAIRDRAESHHGTGLEGSDEPQPRKHSFGFVADLGGGTLILHLAVHRHRHFQQIFDSSKN